MFGEFGDPPEIPDDPFEMALFLKNMLVSRVTGGGLDESVYRQVRQYFIQQPELKSRLPSYIRTCRTDDDIWTYFSEVAHGSGSYAIRRAHVHETLTPLLDYLESGGQSPHDETVNETLESYDAEHVKEIWTKALVRRNDDPEGAITSARTLLEAVCKKILTEADVEYSRSDDLPKLYGKVARELHLAPSQQTAPVFKAILGGCHTIVENLGTLRNRIGDAHAQDRKVGRTPVRPKPRHAALAVNLAGAMATYLIETWTARLEERNDG